MPAVAESDHRFERGAAVCRQLFSQILDVGIYCPLTSNIISIKYCSYQLIAVIYSARMVVQGLKEKKLGHGQAQISLLIVNAVPIIVYLQSNSGGKVGVRGSR